MKQGFPEFVHRSMMSDGELKLPVDREYAERVVKIFSNRGIDVDIFTAANAIMCWFFCHWCTVSWFFDSSPDEEIFKELSRYVTVRKD